MSASGRAEVIDQSLVKGVISSGFPLLRFPSGLEDYFESETRRARSVALVVRGSVGIAFAILVLVVDWLLVPDVFTAALWIRLGVLVPLAIAVVLLLLRNPPPALREAVVGLICVLASTTSLGLMHMSQSPLRDGQHFTVVLVILFITMVQRVRFPYAVASSLAILGIYVVALASLSGYPPERMLTNTIVFGCIVVLALIASYSLERELRMSYLLGLMERLRNSDLETLSRRDALTGLNNRRSLEEVLAGLAAKGLDGHYCAFVLLDIDDFKIYNDTFGHIVGDVCLRRLAGVIQGHLRTEADMAFRFGGEEFLVMLPDVDLPGAIAFAERIRRSIEDASIPAPVRSQQVVTASFGVASAQLGGSVTPQELIASADAALFAAKRNGRNQVWPRFLTAHRDHVVESGREAKVQ